MESRGIALWCTQNFLQLQLLIAFRGGGRGGWGHHASCGMPANLLDWIRASSVFLVDLLFPEMKKKRKAELDASRAYWRGISGGIDRTSHQRRLQSAF